MLFSDDIRRDFDRTVHTVFFPANSANGAERSVSFPVFDDSIDEEAEGFIIVLYPDTNLTSIEVAFTPNLRTTLGRINDNDREPFLLSMPQSVTKNCLSADTLFLSFL